MSITKTTTKTSNIHLTKEGEVVAQKTVDYDQFKFLAENRETDRQHINRLKEVIQHNPQILEVQPILVNERMEIIDGQHRFYAAQELGLPVTYTQVHGLDIQTAREMNVLQRRWILMDYAHSYAKSGNVHYKAFLQYQAEFPGIAPSLMLAALVRNGHNEGITGTFRRGEFVIGRDEAESEDILAKFQKVKNTIGVPFSRALVSALVVCYDNEDFDWERFFTNLERKPELIQRAQVLRDALRMIEDVYNFNRPHRTRLY